MLSLDKLSIKGFKSFVEPTEFEIKSGLTGIVGPNGCGKSNIVEAIRFGLGEVSAKQLRGKEIDDLIFNGTDIKPSWNLAEVGLFVNIDGTDLENKFESKSLEIARKIWRGEGTSSYINGKEVRLKDIQLLFADASTSARSTSIVSQGRIGAITQAKPEDRKMVLEEAAGILGLQSRRHDSELRLKAATNNLLRVEDVITTYEEQLAILKKQSKEAERFRNISTLIKNAEASVFYVKRNQIQTIIQKLEDEKNELQKTIKELAAILKIRKKQDDILVEELEEITNKFGDERRSRIVPDVGEVSIEDLIEDEEIIVSVSSKGYVKSVPSTSYKKQGRGGKGVKAASSDEDVIEHLLSTSVHAYLLFFTDQGKVYRAKAHELPKTTRTAQGSLIHNVLSMSQDEKVQAIIDTRDYETEKFLLIMTEKGTVKKSAFKDFDSNYKSLQAIKLKDDDRVVSVKTTSGKEDVILVSKKGQAIRFDENNLKPQGRTAMGVRGIKLREGDEVVGAATSRDETLLFITAKGYGKRTNLDEFRKAGRGGMGVKALKVTEVKGDLIGARSVDEDTEVMLMSTGGTAIRCAVKQIKKMSRAAQGVKVMKLSKEEQISAFIPIKSD